MTYERIEKGLSRAQLARRSNLSVADVALIEEGKKKPSSFELKKIATALGFPTETACALMNKIKVATLDESGQRVAE